MEVRDVRAYSRVVADRCDLVEPFGGVGFVSTAHVRDIDRPSLGNRLAQGGKFAGVGEDARDIVEPS